MNDVSLKIKIRNNNQKTGEQLTCFPILNLKSLLAFTDDVSAVANETGVRQNTWDGFKKIPKQTDRRVAYVSRQLVSKSLKSKDLGALLDDEFLSYFMSSCSLDFSKLVFPSTSALVSSYFNCALTLIKNNAHEDMSLSCYTLQGVACLSYTQFLSR